MGAVLQVVMHDMFSCAVGNCCRGLVMKNIMRWSYGAVMAGMLVAGPGAAPGVPAAGARAATQASAQPATLPDEEKQAGFKLLFDGVTTTGWRQLGGKTFPAGWDIHDGALHHKPSGGGGDITYDATFENFELRFDFK